ncbi:msx2-interacting protein-like isoform X2 [Mya arenaria]|uniref:msx2-interacting protein-like isoform X2 n=1 Tax=Mya arenaria TaxID=6604 RepID=UPI0022E738B7|nr:msx2-interacting protein-like isoform X2 [Mya arenaria]
MVRETRYLLVGNLPESTTENEITDYFKRFGGIQKVKLERKPDDTDSDEKEEGCITSLTATVAFTDIKSASNAHKAEKKIGNNVISSEYSSGFGATGSVVKRSIEPEIYPRPPSGYPHRKGFEEDDGFDVYYGTPQQYSGEPSGLFHNPQYPERGRQRERWTPGAPFPGRGTKWSAATSRQFSDSGSKDGFEKTKSVPTSSPTTSQSSTRQKKKSKSGDRSRSRSSSNDSRSSSATSESGSASSSKDRSKGLSAVPKSETHDSEIKHSEIEPGEREPLGIYITKLPGRSSDTSLRDGLFHEYKKYGKITAVQVSGLGDGRFAIISFKQAEDAAKALNSSQGKRFFGACIHSVPHEGLEGEDTEFLTPEAQLDEHSPKATRTLFLGNLEKDITTEELKERLEKYGEILDVDVKRQGAITAYAFIQFSDISSVVKSLKDLDGITWGTTKLKVGFGKSMATPVVWLGNLADTVHEGFLYRQFQRFGALSHTVVDKENHRGLVFFIAPESAQYALPEMRNRIWNGKKIHIDYASRDCQESFFKKMEASGQLRPGERPDPRWMQNQIAKEPPWEESNDPNFTKRGGFNQFRGRGRGFQRGRGFFRGRGGAFDPGYPQEGFMPRKMDEFGTGSAFMEEDSYERQLQEYGQSQQHRQERSQSPGMYENFYEGRSQTGQEFDPYDPPARYTTYRSPSPGSDRDLDIASEDFKMYKRTPSDERYYFKEKYFEAGSRSRDRSHSSDSEQRYRLQSELMRRRSRSRSPTIATMKMKQKTKDLPLSYRSQTSPSPTDEPFYHSDHSPSDYRIYKRPSSLEGERKSGVLVNMGLRKEIDLKSEERMSRKRSYDQLSPRLERQHSRGSRTDSIYEYDREKSARGLISEVARLRSELNERTGIKDSPSSSSSSDNIDPSTLTEAELAKLHREKQKLLQKLNIQDSDSDGDSRYVSSKKARLEAKYHRADPITKLEIKEKLKKLDEKSRKKELRDIKKSKSLGDSKLDYSEEDTYNSPGYNMPKKRRKMDSESDNRSRSYRSRLEDDHGFSSDDERMDLQRQTSTQRDMYSSKSRPMSSLDARLESDVFAAQTREETRRTSSGSDNNKEQGETKGRRRKHKKEHHITPLIPLGDDDMPDPETADPRPRTPPVRIERPMVLPLPDFAQFIQFSPLPSPRHSPERYRDHHDDHTQHHHGDNGSNGSEQSPCFSPQSSSSKTHSPSQSPSGSGSDSKGNTNSESGSGELPPGFPKETEQIDPDENKADSLDSIPDPPKVTEPKKDDDSFSDNNSDLDLASDNLAIEERIRLLDEKWNKAQAVSAITPKILPDMDSVVGNNVSSSCVLTNYSPPIVAPAQQGSTSPAVSSLYSKFKIKKRNDGPGATTDKPEQSEIVQTVLSKSSIFDQDSKRLGQINDSLDTKDNSLTNDNSPKAYSAWNKLDPRDNPMVTVPGSLLDRLGQGNNGSFPTLTTTTTFPSVTNNVNFIKPPVVSSSNFYGFESSINDQSVFEKTTENKLEEHEKSDEEEEKFRDQTKLNTLLNNKIPHLDYNSKEELDSTKPIMHKTDDSLDLNKSDANDSANILVKDESVNEMDLRNCVDTSLDESLNTGAKDNKSEKVESKLVQEAREDKKSAEIVKEEPLIHSGEDSVKPEKVKKENGFCSPDNSMLSNEGSKDKTYNDIQNPSDISILSTDDKTSTVNESPQEPKIRGILKKSSESDISGPVKIEVDTSTDSAKQADKSHSEKEKHSHKPSSSKSEKDDTKEPSHKKQKVSKEKDKKDSSHKDDKHKKKEVEKREGEKKSESSHKPSNSASTSSSVKKDDKKDRHKSKSEKDKKDTDKKSKDEKKESKEEKKKKSEKKDKEKKDEKSLKESRDEKSSEKVKQVKKEEKSEKEKDKGGEKKEKKEKHEKKEHKHEKHGSTKSPEKKPKSSHKEGDSNKDSLKDKPKEGTLKEHSSASTSSSKDSEKGGTDKEKEKIEKGKIDKKSSEQKKEHKSSHKSSKKSKDESSASKKAECENNKKQKEESSDSKKNKDEENKKPKDDHSEHKKKDESSNRNNKDSPDKSKDVNRKESTEKKSSSDKAKEKISSEKCKEEKSKSKEKENKDKDPDHSKSKSKAGESGDKPKIHSNDSKSERTDTEKDDSKKAESSRKEEKKKDSEIGKNSSTLSKPSTKDNDKQKSDKFSKNSESKPKMESKVKEKTPSKKEKEPAVASGGLTEEDLKIFAQFSDEPYMSMYDKVKRRSTEKKLHDQKEQEEQKKLLHEYKRNHKKNISLSDITESSEFTSDEDRSKPSSAQKTKKKFVFSSDDSESSTDPGVVPVKKTPPKNKIAIKKPKRILDIYSSDSEEEEEMANKHPAKKTMTHKKNKPEVQRDSDHKFEFDSISDSDNKTSATQHAKAKTVGKTCKKTSRKDSKPQRNGKKDSNQSRKLPRKDLSFKDLFSDDSDNSLLSDSDSDSDILLSPKSKKKPFLTNKPDKNRKTIPRGSSIYTSSEESETEDEFRSMSPPRTSVLPKKTEMNESFFKEPVRKNSISDSFTSDNDDKPFVKIKKSSIMVNHKNCLDSFDSDSHLSDTSVSKFSRKNILSNDLEKIRKQKNKEITELHKKNNKMPDILRNEDHPFQNLAKLEVARVYTEYEHDKLLSNLTNKDNLPPVLTDITKEPLFKLDADSVRNDIPTLKDISLDLSGKSKNKKHKKESKKKKKSKDKDSRDSSRDRTEQIKNDFLDHGLMTNDTTDNWIPDSDAENAVNRNVFDTIKSPDNKKKKEQKKESPKVKKNPEYLSEFEFLSDSEKKNMERKSKDLPKDLNSDVFDFQDEERGTKPPIKESHMKTAKENSHDAKLHQEDYDHSAVGINTDIEYKPDEQDYKDEGNVCPIVETTEVVIEQAPEEKTEKGKPKKRKGQKNSSKDTGNLTQEAVSNLVKEDETVETIQTEIVPFDTPVSLVSNEHELVIDEGVSLHVEDETEKAVDSIVNENDECDETAKAVESILLDGMPTYAISEPVEPTPQLDQNYLQPGFAPGLPNIPPAVSEVESNEAAVGMAKKGRKGRKAKTEQGEGLLNDSAGKLSDGKPFDLLSENSFTSVMSSSLDDTHNDDDDDGRLQIDFDPPKPEAKQKKTRKPKQTKAEKMATAAAMAAVNKLDNIFGNFNRGQDKDGELNRDSLSSESSEMERSKHEELLFMDREDQRHDSDLMSPDERSTSDDITSPTDITKVKSRRGRKPKNKDAGLIATTARQNSPRGTRTLSPRSPRSNFDPRSPKSDSFDPRLNGPKNLVIDEGPENKCNKAGSNVFDFDDNDEQSSNSVQVSVTPATKQRKPYQRRKKGESALQSPDRGMFSSPEHKQDEKLVIASPDSKGIMSPEQKIVFGMEKKGLFSPTFKPEEQTDLKSATDDEPLFKAFFEGRPKNDIEKVNPLLAKIQKETENGLSAEQIASNVDKTIDDVAKGLFESTDEESGTPAVEQVQPQKRRHSKNCKDEEMMKSPDVKSPIKSPIAKSPVVNVKSPMMNSLHSPPIPYSQPLVLPGMGIGQPSFPAQIGEPQVAGHVPLMSPPASRPPVNVSASEAQRPPSPLKNPPSPGKSTFQLQVKTTILQSPIISTVIPTLAQSLAATITSPSTASSTSASTVSEAHKTEPTNLMGEALKEAVPGFLVPGIAVTSALGVVQGMTTVASITQTVTVSSSISELQKRQQQQIDKLAQEQLLEQQKVIDQQKQAELQRQQEHHVKLKEQELKKKEQEMKQREMEQNERTKKLEELKLLQQQHEQLRQHQQALQAGVTIGPGVQTGQQALLSPGAIQRTIPSLPSPGDKQGPRGPLVAHHQMPQGAPFGLPGQHPAGLPIRPGQFPAHLTPAQIHAMQQQLGQDPKALASMANAEVLLKHQQLQAQMKAQQAQALAEQQVQMAKQQQVQQTKQSSKAGKGQGPQANKKVAAVDQQRPTSNQISKDAPLPGSQEAANQLTQQIKQQLALQAQQQQAPAGLPPHASHPLHNWQLQTPRQPAPHCVPPMSVESRTSMPGPVPVLGGNPQQAQRVSPLPPTKSPTVAQTAPNMVHGFSQHQTAAPRAPSPAVAKTAERQAPAGGKWVGGGVAPRQSPPDPRPRTSSDTTQLSVRPDQWVSINGPTVQPSSRLSPAPRPAHQQPPSAHQQQPDHAIQLTRPTAQPATHTAKTTDKFMQQQMQELQRQEMIKHQQEMQRHQQLREQALHAQAQKEVQIHKERERAESLEREKREAHSNTSDPRQSPAIRGIGYPFVEPRPPSPNGKHPQSPAIDPRDPRFAQQFAGHHPADLRLGSSQASAFSPAAGQGTDAAHMYTQAEFQRLQQNGLLPAYPPSLLMREPHLIPGHGPPYMIPGHLAHFAQQMEHQHLVDGRPPSRGTGRPPSNQPAAHTMSPSQQQQEGRGQNRAPQGQTMGPPSRDPHPGDGSLLGLLQRYPVMWQGVLGLKNDQCVVQMHFISGFQPLVKMSLPQPAQDGTVQPLRIAQRMRLEQTQLEGVEKRMQLEKDYCMMLALPCGRDHTDIYQQTRAMSTGFIQYLQQKQAAGIVNVADPGSQQPAYVVHIFPPCDFSQTTLQRLGFDLLYQVKDLAHLIVIIATVA